MIEELPPHNQEKRVLEIPSVTGRDYSSQIQQGGDFDVFFARNSSFHQSFNKAILSQFSDFFSRFDGNAWHPYQEDHTQVENDKGIWNGLYLCYGGHISIPIQESVSTLEWVLKLSINRHEPDEDLAAQIAEFILKCSQDDCVIGVTLLSRISRYQACSRYCYPRGTKILRTLSDIVFSPDNIESNYPEVIDGCIMKMPALFLDWAQFPNRLFELTVRIRYNSYHGEDPRNQHKILQLASEEAKSLSSSVITRVADITGPCSQMCLMTRAALARCEETVKKLQNEVIQIRKNEERLLQKAHIIEKEKEVWKAKFEDEVKKATVKINGEDYRLLFHGPFFLTLFQQEQEEEKSLRLCK